MANCYQSVALRSPSTSLETRGGPGVYGSRREEGLTMSHPNLPPGRAHLPGVLHPYPEKLFDLSGDRTRDLTVVRLER